MPIPPPGYSAVGCVAHPGSQPPPNHIVHCLRADLLTSTNFSVFKCDYPAISARPVQFTKVAHVIGKGLDEAFFWYPTPPPGYASFGCIVTTTDESPKKDFVCCPRLDLTHLQYEDFIPELHKQFLHYVQGMANLEVEVTNLASKAGKGTNI
ncbi:hypothetical protein BHE74_00005220 [Ensete ventricosum]|nr:hypothetical protein BHE74_00005220 [Ensete ventricosum]